MSVFSPSSFEQHCLILDYVIIAFIPGSVSVHCSFLNSKKKIELQINVIFQFKMNTLQMYRYRFDGAAIAINSLNFK